MKKSRNTGRALFFSVLSMVMCMTMLVGSTYAWFTDSASTGVNVIQSGNLDVILEVAYEWDGEGNPSKWESAEGRILDFVHGSGKDREILWEPGAAYKLPELRITNKGSLDFKFQVFINGLSGDTKLAKVLDVYKGEVKEENRVGTLEDVMTLATDVDGIIHGNLKAGESTEVYEIVMKMQEDAGNDYQNLLLNGISITVFATQAASESDSFDNQYDADAEFDRKYIENQSEFFEAFANLEDGGSLILKEDMILDDLTADKNMTIFLNGKTLHVSQINLVEGKILTLKGGNVSPVTLSGKGNIIFSAISVNATEAQASAVTIAEGSEVTILLENDNNFQGAEKGNGINVLKGAELILKGFGSIKAVGNGGIDYRDENGDVLTGDKAFVGGSGIRVDGTLLIDTVPSVTALGYGTEGYGIGGNTASLTIKNSEILEVLGGNAQATALADTTAHEAAEGKPAIGTGLEGGVVTITNTVVRKATGGIKAQAIGSEYQLQEKVTVIIEDEDLIEILIDGAE